MGVAGGHAGEGVVEVLQRRGGVGGGERGGGGGGGGGGGAVLRRWGGDQTHGVKGPVGGSPAHGRHPHLRRPQGVLMLPRREGAGGGRGRTGPI